jgi:type IV fimbrial biogenesis protein FimT
VKSKDEWGFTLLELIITLVIFSVLIGVSAPSFSKMIESHKMKRLATELEWLLVQAKSEAVMRNQEVIVHLIKIGKGVSEANKTSDWRIEVKSISDGLITLLDGANFKDIEINRTFSSEQIIFDALYGKPNQSGSFYFNLSNNKKLRTTIFNRTGRVYSCSYKAEEYGYEKC